MWVYKTEVWDVEVVTDDSGRNDTVVDLVVGHVPSDSHLPPMGEWDSNDNIVPENTFSWLDSRVYPETYQNN